MYVITKTIYIIKKYLVVYLVFVCFIKNNLFKVVYLVLVCFIK